MSSRARRLLHLVFAVAGVLAVVALVRAVGLVPLLQLLRRGLPVLPWLLAIEVVRIGLEASCTWFLCGPFPRTTQSTPSRHIDARFQRASTAARRSFTSALVHSAHASVRAGPCTSLGHSDSAVPRRSSLASA